MEKKIIKKNTILSSFEKSKYFRPQAITLLEYLKDFSNYLENLDVAQLDQKIDTETNDREQADSELQHDIDNHIISNVHNASITLSGNSGTLTDNQLLALKNNRNCFILIDIEDTTVTPSIHTYEKYYLMDYKIANGYLTYSHVEKESTNYKIKTITITISTKGWVLTEQAIKKLYRHKVKLNNTLVFHELINGSNVAFTLDTFKTYMKGGDNDTKCYNCCGWVESTMTHVSCPVQFLQFYVHGSSTDVYKIIYYDVEISTLESVDITSINDTVSEI